MISGLQQGYVYFRDTKKYRKNETQIQDALKQANVIINDNQSIKNALIFLDSVTTNEQEKELSAITDFIQNQKEQLSQYIPNFENSELNKKLNDPNFKIENIESFYNDFIIILNGSRKGLEETKDRIKTIQRNIHNQYRKFSDYQTDDYRFKLTSDISSFIKRLTGQYSRENINDSTISAKLQTIAIQTINQLGLAEKVSSGADFVAISSIILTDLQHQAQIKLDQYMKQVNKEGATFNDLSDNVYQQIQAEYLQGLKEKNPSTHIQQMLLDSLDNINESILSLPIKNAKSILNLKSNVQQTKNIIGNITNKNKNLEGELQKLQKSISQNKSLNESLYTINFSLSSSRGRHGDINEFISSIINGGKVRANVAVDLVTYNIGYNIERNQAIDNKIELFTETLSSIGDYLSQSKKIEDRQLTSKLTDVNKELLNVCDQIDVALKETGNTQKIYITHESLKLSTRAERGQEFHGRKMSIFSYISYLCSANLSGFNVGNEDILQFLAYNLVQGAAADDLVNPLEAYFSMFAGMLMFDDVQNMAIEAVKRIKEKKPISVSKDIIQIHLYNLNGLYIPASMILSFVRDEMLTMCNITQTNRGAQAHISFNSNASINNSRKDRIEAAKKTKVEITFLGGFTNLIDNLFPNG